MTTAPTPPPCAPRLAALRAELAKRGLDGFVVPHSDEHQSEYLPACAERLAWLTAFTGSAGAAVVLKDKAAVFVDGRYTLQVRAQTDTILFEPRDLVAEGPQGWIPDNLPQGRQARLTIPGCTPPMAWRACAQAAERAGGSAGRLRHQSDRRGVDRPARRRRSAKAVPHALNLAGERATPSAPASPKT